MKGIVIVFLFFMSTVLGNEMLARTQNTAGKKIECSVEIMPNYLWHLFAVSDIFDNGTSEYSEKYGNTIPDTDKKILYDNRDFLKWGQGKTSMFTELLFFTPFRSEINFDDYCKYLDLIHHCDVNSEWDIYFAKYIPGMVGTEMISNPDITERFLKISTVIKNNYKTYVNEVWRDIEPILAQKKNNIDTYFSNNDFINTWEQNLNMKYDGNGFKIVLTYANAFGKLPSANDLSNSRNNFAIPLTEPGMQKMYGLVIHEIGIFTFMPVIKELRMDNSLNTDFNVKNNAVYQAFEVFIEKRMFDICGENTYQSSFQFSSNIDFKWFLSFYREHDKNNIAPEMLIRNAITEYSKK